MPHVGSMSHRASGSSSSIGVPHHAVVWLAYITFVVYGSLVPLDFHPRPLDQAWAAFQHLRMLQVGAQGRADWVANGFLFLPVGFLTAVLFADHKTRLARLSLLVAAALFCFALAVAVEFTQLFFPPRTVSQNDVIAESIGSVLGIIFAVYWSHWFREVLATVLGKLGHLLTRVLQAYAVVYIALSLLPFDFVLSLAELAAKAHSDTWGWFLAASSTSRGPVILVAKILAEILAVVPLGLMLARRNATRKLPATRHAVLYGILLGLAIEAVQFFMFSGISQGASLLTRAAGIYGGARLWRQQMLLRDLHLHARSRRLIFSLSLFYLLALVAVNGFFDHSWHGVELAGKTLAETRFLPFYYHYYTTEQAALLSLLSVVMMYAPVGVLAWLCWWPPAMAFWAAALTATSIESSKLFLTGLHPDPTNVLIGAMAAWSVIKLLQRLEEASTLTGELGPVSAARPVVQPAGQASSSTSGRSPPQAWPALAATLMLTAWVVIDFPFRPLLIGLLLLCYAALLWFRPPLLWVAIPAAIPLLDLAPWSGRFYLDEFDFLIIVSLVVGYARTRPAPKSSNPDVVGLAVACLLALTFAISTLHGMLPLTPPDANSFTNYYSPYNALRIAKGALWALLIFVLARRFTLHGRNIRGWFASGMVVGLTGTIAVVIWERFVFPGLLNFTDDYRVTGPFSQMHTGGAEIETYLTAALPFAVVLTIRARSLATRLAGGLLLMGASYALAVTYSRGGYAGSSVALIIAALATLLPQPATTAARSGRGSAQAPVEVGLASNIGTSRSSVYRWSVPLVLIALAVAVALPIYSGSFAQQRMSRIGADLATRQAHWTDALAMRDPGLATTLFGMGIGRFPETHYWRSTEPKASNYRLETEAGNTFLRLGTGDAMYMEQFVSIEPGQEYVVHLDIRSPQSGASVSTSLCEKLLLTSGRCAAKTALVTGEGRQWQSHELRLASGDIGRGAWRPVKFSLHNASRTRVDIDNVQLLTAEGEQITRNGDFAQNLDRWFFSVDEHLPWHAKTMPVAILFDQGWFGLAAFGALVGLGIKRTTRSALRGDPLAGATLASLTGVLVIAALDTVIDTPRFLLLFLLLTWMGWAGGSSSNRHPA
ncbi:conserved membrane hypothetical protein [Candidatus Accumulibacter aalborgensis]|uniref:VanZ-like domain-containing protein n=2 Tax=Candidatus Accumulibacter aalborgensis TaxID=1860102 RepID=A0A1A8XYW4_9PROT|nr:conserved membrane hypothetical protein [Candidatus Accumulibacter aalborgensis]